MKKMNKKGFTLIELLAVIVVLAIVMVIATQRITNVVNNSRANSFVDSYKVIVKQINTNIVADPDRIECTNDGSKGNKCSDVYDVSSDYVLNVSNVGDYYKIELSASSTGKFKNLDLTRYGDAAGTEKVTNKDGSTTTKSVCVASKVDNTVTSPEDGYPAGCEKQKITGFVTK